MMTLHHSASAPATLAHFNDTIYTLSTLISIPCPEILLESVATQTYCIFFTVYSIGAIKITKIVLDSFFKWSTALSEMHQVRNRVGGRWAQQPTQIKCSILSLLYNGLLARGVNLYNKSPPCSDQWSVLVNAHCGHARLA